MSTATVERNKRAAPHATLPISTLRCYVCRINSNVWIAECVDLDLIVKNRTPELAISNLRDSIRGYLNTVVAGEGAITGLIPRPSPLSHRLRYRWFLLKAVLLRSQRNFRSFECSAAESLLCIG